MTEEELEREVARTIYDAVNGLDGDTIGTMLHENFRIEVREGDKGFGDLDIALRSTARAVLSRLKELKMLKSL